MSSREGALLPTEAVAEAQAIADITHQFADTEEADVTFLLSQLSAARAAGGDTRKIVALFRKQVLHAGISEMFRRRSAPATAEWNALKGCVGEREAGDKMAAELTCLTAEAERLRLERNDLKHGLLTWNVVEIAGRGNVNVRSYCDHWEKRAEAAEAEVERLTRAMRVMRDVDANRCREISNLTAALETVTRERDDLKGQVTRWQEYNRQSAKRADEEAAEREAAEARAARAQKVVEAGDELYSAAAEVLDVGARHMPSFKRLSDARTEYANAYRDFSTPKGDGATEGGERS